MSSGEGSAQTSKGDASDGDAADDASYADAGGCHPIDISGFDAATTVPTAPRSLACNGFNGDGGIVPSFGDACLFHSPEYPPCASFDVGDAAGAAECYRCLVSPPTADGTFPGVVAILSGVADPNYASCIQLADPTEAGAACALDLQTAVACIFYACQSTCPVTDEASVAAITTCMNEALSGACAGYALKMNACLAVEEGNGGTPVATICFPGSTPAEKYLSFAHYLCGGG